jgi:hypothetical protein
MCQEHSELRYTLALVDALNVQWERHFGAREAVSRTLHDMRTEVLVALEQATGAPYEPGHQDEELPFP